MLKKLTLNYLRVSVSDFISQVNKQPIKELYGVTDGKAVGTYVEHRFHSFLQKQFTYDAGCSASGIDFPRLNVDLKVTSIRQPQSSCPYRDAGQKIYGLGYHLIVLVYQKSDDRKKKVAVIKFLHAIFVDKQRTGDYQTTYGINQILRNHGNCDDIKAYLEERNLPLDEIGRETMAGTILQRPPKQGYLTISNALQ